MADIICIFIILLLITGFADAGRSVGGGNSLYSDDEPEHTWQKWEDEDLKTVDHGKIWRARHPHGYNQLVDGWGGDEDEDD